MEKITDCCSHADRRPGAGVGHPGGGRRHPLHLAGYVLVGHSEGFRQVTGKFKVPSVTCTSSNSKASFWIGLDGWNYETAHSNTVEQVGISTDCANFSPQIRAWWEMAPNGTQYQFNVSPGDTISMLVKYVGGPGIWPHRPDP